MCIRDRIRKEHPPTHTHTHARTHTHAHTHIHTTSDADFHNRVIRRLHEAAAIHCHSNVLFDFIFQRCLVYLYPATRSVCVTLFSNVVWSTFTLPHALCVCDFIFQRCLVHLYPALRSVCVTLFSNVVWSTCTLLHALYV